MNIHLIFIFLFLKLLLVSQVSQEKFLKSTRTYKENGERMIDSLKYMNIDTIIAYNSYKTRSIANEEFNIVYVENKIRKQILIIRNKNSLSSYIVLKKEHINSIYFDIVNEYSVQLFSLISNNALFEDTISYTHGVKVTGGLTNHGIGYFFYIKLGNNEKSHNFCCNIDLNEKVYKRAFPLWKLASAFNNQTLR